MVKPGSAWKKPGVNPGFRSAVVAHARQAAAQPPIDKLEEKLREVVSRLDTDRRGDAHRAISQACKKLRDGKNPRAGLKPPAPSFMYGAIGVIDRRIVCVQPKSPQSTAKFPFPCTLV